MKKLILVAVILQLVITVIEINGEYQFGDIVAFPRGCQKFPAYKHYAIYVGPESGVNVRQGDNDIFHRSGKSPTTKTRCDFGKLEDTGNHKKENYLDGEISPGTQEQIIQRIQYVKDNCEKYNLFTNNCEHLATFVRYNVSISEQCGTAGGQFMKLSTKTKEILKKLKDEQTAKAECIASSALGEQLSWHPMSACLALVFSFLIFYEASF